MLEAMLLALFIIFASVIVGVVAFAVIAAVSYLIMWIITR